MSVLAPDLLIAIAAATGVLACLLLLCLLIVAAATAGRARLRAEQVLAAQRAEAETTRRALAEAERALAAAIQAGTTDALGRAFAEITAGSRATGERIERLATDTHAALADARTAQARSLGDLAVLLETKLRQMGEANALKLAEIERRVNEHLQAAVKQQMETSFARVIDQFTAVQKAMGDVQAVTAQIGDIKRLFANVKTRGGWGETQLRILLDEVLPNRYAANIRLREGSAEVVEFAVRMPMRGSEPTWLPVDAKFPIEDYERMLAAAEDGDAEAERAARQGLATRLRLEARKIAEKYINPPVTVDFAVLYLPTDGLFAEVARVPGLIDEIGRAHHVIILGPSLAPALLRTIHLGFVTLKLEEGAAEVHRLLGATRTEMGKMDEVLERLGRNAATMSNTIDAARRRTRAVVRKLRAVEAADDDESARLLELEDEAAADAGPRALAPPAASDE